MNRSPKALISLLEKKGFIYKRSNGSHHIFYNERTEKTAVVPVHGKKDLPAGTFFAILRQAGIDKTEL
jgi:predicted RNA binding protein YcfA (HicA-like mRNA interferase family)